MNVVSKKCEVCQLKQSCCGLPAGGNKWHLRWCSGCGKGHVGAVNVKMGRVKNCEGCGLKVPSLGLPADGKARWCTSCRKAQVGAVSRGERHQQQDAMQEPGPRRGQLAGREGGRAEETSGRAKNRATVEEK